MTDAPTTPNVVTPARYAVRECVCTYRPLRDADGHIASVPTLTMHSPRDAAHALAPLLAGEPVEVFAVACLSTRKRLLAWHVVSRGSRNGTQVSMPDVFVPAVLTPGTTGLIVLHNHPSGETSPSADDIAITRRLQASAAILGIDVLDHLIVGDEGRYYSFREAGLLRAGVENALTTGHTYATTSAADSA